LKSNADIARGYFTILPNLMVWVGVVLAPHVYFFL